ncbi:MAG TPA: NAD-dependent epimerase/dehydratase family protein, partial [Chitinophagaceae bacterium]|nr:NAD-dependent epimerase/dehydratase family protein [Chitinophagaceae bacterium]
NVVNVMLEKNINRLVYISSVAALGRTAGGGHVNEERKWEDSKINTHYSITKHKAEMEVWRGISEGLNAVILNPSTILGFGDWTTGSCAIFKNIQKGISWFTPGINGFVDVEDVAKATMQILESEITEQRFIVNGHTWPFKKLQETIAENFGKKKPTRAANPFLLGIAWRIEKIKSLLTGHKPLLTKESAKVACSQTWFENEKLLNALPGFTYRPLEETIKKACDQYKQIAS